jgi:predicted deacylase
VIRRHDLAGGHALEIHDIGSDDGPTLAVLGGVHGDELEGVVAARMFAAQLNAMPAGTLAGRAKVVPVSNPVAFASRSRTSATDGANLARVFPGRPDGTVTEQIAHVLTSEVIAGADLLVDLHSAGAKYEMPVFAGFVSDAPMGSQSGEATFAFGAPMVWEHHGSGPGRSMSAAEDLGVASIYVEGSGGGGLIGRDLDIYVDGLHRLLAWLGMTSAPHTMPSPPVVLRGDDGDVDESLACSLAGYCVTRVRAGDVVQPGHVLADIVNDAGDSVEQIRSPRPGIVMMLRRQAEVQPADGIAMLGPVPDDPGVA